MQNDQVPETLTIFNPTNKDFEVLWLDDKNQEWRLTAKALQLTTFPFYQGKHIRKHLAQDIAMHKKGHFDENLIEAFKEIDCNDSLR